MNFRFTHCGIASVAFFSPRMYWPVFAPFIRSIQFFRIHSHSHYILSCVIFIFALPPHPPSSLFLFKCNVHTRPPQQQNTFMTKVTTFSMNACAITPLPLRPPFRSNWIELNMAWAGAFSVSVRVESGFFCTWGCVCVWHTTMNWNALSLSSFLSLFKKYERQDASHIMRFTHSAD